MAYEITDKKRAEWAETAKKNQDEARNLIHEIGKSYTRSPEKIAELLEFSSQFYKYSINNTELIYAQNKYATYVQSYSAWQKMDAHVKKGEKGLKIWVPVISTVLQLENGEIIALEDATREQRSAYEQGLIKGQKSVKFKIGNVLDISQTDFPKEKLPEIYNKGYTSEKHAEITEGLIKFCLSKGCGVRTASLDSITLNGNYAPDSNLITINNNLEDTARLSTLTHEMGHFLEAHGDRDISTVQKEFEADAISVLIQSMFGIEINDQRKAHLAFHYKEFIGELKSKNPNIDEDEQIKLVDEVLGNSLDIFKKNAEEMKKFVDENIAKNSIVENVVNINDIENTSQIQMAARRHRAR